LGLLGKYAAWHDAREQNHQHAAQRNIGGKTLPFDKSPLFTRPYYYLDLENDLDFQPPDRTLPAIEQP